MQNAVDLAVQQANENHTISGYTLVPVPYNDVGSSGSHDPATGANNITQAVADALISGCIGPANSIVAKAEMPIANQAPLALISPSTTNETITKPQYSQTSTLRPTGKVTYFRVVTTDDQQGIGGADYLYKQLNKRNAYIIDDGNQTYGKALADGFAQEWTKLGGVVAGRSQVGSSATDCSSQLATAAAASVDTLYFGGYDYTGGTACRQQMTNYSGLRNAVYAGGDGLFTDSFRTSTGAAGVGSLSTVAGVNPDVLSSAQPFITAFKAKYSNPSDYGAYSASAYDATNILIQAIKRALVNGASNASGSSDAAGAKLFRQKVIDEIAKTNYSGAIGTTAFDANGDTTNRWISVYRLDSSDWQFVTQLTV